MKKKYIYLLIVLCLVMTYIIYAYVDTDKESVTMPEHDPLKMTEEEKTVYGKALAQYEGAIINDRLITYFKKEYGERDGHPSSYPYNFAGTYLNDDGKLVIQISGNIDTELLNEEYSSYVNVKSIKDNDESFKADMLSDVVVYEKAKYSLIVLNYMKDDVAKILSKHFTVIGSYIDTFNNIIVLEIEREEFDKLNDIDAIIGEYFRKDFPLIIQFAEITELDSN